ncbi:hypothetical protein ECANGB1_853 [Enterospora canceri]|uniref:Uncharacterized protein n=1 Tax=Enterospora canceri TaxID=1081671 RepID=A0A1Y1S7B6_9MICR|nr:hypothetical protein ECANGB1_853 [Enterospora canceri]
MNYLIGFQVIAEIRTASMNAINDEEAGYIAYKAEYKHDIDRLMLYNTKFVLDLHQLTAADFSGLETLFALKCLTNSENANKTIVKLSLLLKILPKKIINLKNGNLIFNDETRTFLYSNMYCCMKMTLKIHLILKERKVLVGHAAYLSEMISKNENLGIFKDSSQWKQTSLMLVNSVQKFNAIEYDFQQLKCITAEIKNIIDTAY